MTGELQTAMIMAGGQGSRMHRSGVSISKPLVDIQGVTLIERNLHQLLKHGFRRIFVSVNRNANDIQRLAEGRLKDVARTCGALLETVAEDVPLGNIGAIRLLPKDVDEALIVYADNLTTLNLRTFSEAHKSRGKAMTIATHREPFQMPFGEVVLDDNQNLSDYLEKPTRHSLVCSAVAVVGAQAMEAVIPAKPFGISQLCRALVASEQGVATVLHDSPWTDVNDASAFDRAGALIADNPAFDLWAPADASPKRVDLSLCASGGSASASDTSRNGVLKVFDHVPDGGGAIYRYTVGQGPTVATSDKALLRRIKALVPHTDASPMALSNREGIRCVSR